MTSPPDPQPETPSLAARWRAARQRWWVRWGLDGLLAVAVFLVVTAIQSAGLVSSGDPAPDFALRDMDGQLHQLSDYRGRKVLVAFWAPWCGVCKAESGNLSAVRQAVAGDAEVISVVVGYDGLDSVRRFMDEHGVDYPVLLGDGALASSYNVNKFPTLYVIDEEGRVEHADVGYTTELGMRWRLWF